MWLQRANLHEIMHAASVFLPGVVGNGDGDSFLKEW